MKAIGVPLEASDIRLTEPATAAARFVEVISGPQLRWLCDAPPWRDALATRWDRAALGTHADDRSRGRWWWAQLPVVAF